MVATEHADVILRDGGTLRLRPPHARRRRRAAGLLRRALAARASTCASTASRSSARGSSSRSLEPDWQERGALLGTLADGRTAKRVVAVANYVRLRDPTLAEAAFAVADEQQGRGIGTRLLEQLAARAAAVGIERFVAEVLPDNRAMLGVFESAGFELTRELEGGELEVQFPIAADRELPRARRRARPRSRRRLAASRSSRPQSVAVIGASQRRGSIGGELFRNILAGDFAGAAYPVNRDGEPVAGVRALRARSRRSPTRSTSP